MRILLIEDDPLLGDGIQVGLGLTGFAVDWVRDGETAWTRLETETFDALVLDWNLPRLSGLDLLSRCRQRGQNVPILVLTARDTVPDKLRALDGGADDYVVKPFDLDELAARLRSLIRRSHGRTSPRLGHGPIELDPAARRAYLAGQEVELSPREFALLETLLENAGRVLTRAQLEAAAYGGDGAVESNAVEVYIHHLRRKFGNDLIRTVRGVGYLVDRPVRTGESPAP